MYTIAGVPSLFNRIFANLLSYKRIEGKQILYFGQGFCRASVDRHGNRGNRHETVAAKRGIRGLQHQCPLFR